MFLDYVMYFTWAIRSCFRQSVPRHSPYLDDYGTIANMQVNNSGLGQNMQHYGNDVYFHRTNKYLETDCSHFAGTGETSNSTESISIAITLLLDWLFTIASNTPWHTKYVKQRLED